MATLLFCGSAVGCLTWSSTAPRVQIDGSSTVYPIMEAVAEEFGKEHREVQVTVGISGTGGGFKKFCSGEVDITDASRPIKPVEIETCAANDITYIEVPVAFDGLSVVVSPRNSWAHAVTVDELKRMWEPQAQNTIMRWKQVRPSWPDQPLNLFGAGVDSGTYDYFTAAIVGEEHSSRGDYTSSEDDNVVVQGIMNDENAIGFLGFAYYDQNRDKLRALAVDDQLEDDDQGGVLPSPETVQSGSYQPLSRPLFVYVRTESLQRPEAHNFVHFMLTRAGPLVAEVGYIPLPDPLYQLVWERVASRRTGTLFGHGSQVGVSLEALFREEREGAR
jgi:phosphate transport system substrate-binding protein